MNDQKDLKELVKEKYGLGLRVEFGYQIQTKKIRLVSI
jgi:hypothetical protein